MNKKTINLIRTYCLVRGYTKSGVEKRIVLWFSSLSDEKKNQFRVDAKKVIDSFNERIGSEIKK